MIKIKTTLKMQNFQTIMIKISYHSKVEIRQSHLGFVYIFSYLASSHFITKTNPESHFQE